jgi:hypothetical protein
MDDRECEDRREQEEALAGSHGPEDKL